MFLHQKTENKEETLLPCPHKVASTLGRTYKKKQKEVNFLIASIATARTVSTVKRDGRSGGVQMVTLTEKLTNLKYELLMAYLYRDIDFFNELSL
jgi:hypothetical protein